MKKLLPPRDLVWFDPNTGRPTDIFFDWAKSVDERVLHEPVSTTAAADTEVMVFDATAGVWKPGSN